MTPSLADGEHPEVSLTRESGGCLSAFPDGRFAWENIEGSGAARHMAAVLRSEVRRLCATLAQEDSEPMSAPRTRDLRKVHGTLAGVRPRSEREHIMFDDEVDPRGRGATGPVIVVSGPAGVGKSAVSRQIAAVFDRSVHLQTDDFLASIVSVRADPSSPEGHAQNWAVGAALAVSAMTFGELGYVTVVDGTLFPDGVGGLAAACAARRLACHYVVLTADLDTCWVRARTRSASRWPLEREPFEMLHARFGALGLREERLVDASASLDTVCDAVLSAFRAGRLIAEPGPSTPPRTG